MIHISNGNNSDSVCVNVGDVIVGSWGNPSKITKINKELFTLKCPEHGIFTVIPSRLHKKCPSCPRVATTLNFIAKAKSVHGNRYTYKDTEYTGSTVKLVIGCKIHGKFEQEPRIHLSGKGCIQCGYGDVGKANKFSEEEREVKALQRKEVAEEEKIEIRRTLWRKLKKRLEKLGGGFIYKHLKVKNGRYKSFPIIKITCIKHEETFIANTKQHIAGVMQCTSCISEIKLAEKLKRRIESDELKRIADKELQKKRILLKESRVAEDLEARRKKFLKVAKKKHPEIDYSPFIYVDKDTESTAICNKHGEFLATPGCHSRSVSPCKECLSESQSIRVTKSTKHFIKRSKEQFGNKYDYSKSEYAGKGKKITVVCKTHGEFSVVAGNHMYKKTNYGGCPDCRTTAARKHGGEIEGKVSKFINRLGFEVKPKDRSVLKPYEIDLFIPEKEFGIEINGEYWHSTKFRDKKYHSMKARMAEDSGVVLYQFWYRELRESASIVKSMISSALGRSKIIYARKTEIRKIDRAERRCFFQRNHLQSDCRASVAYGLYEGEDLVACMSFGRPRFTNKYEWEILRFANALNTTVVGGASKLWTHFLRTHNPNNVLTYADRRYSTGKLYETLGFEFSGITPPNYFWHNKFGEVVYRYESQKHKLKKLLGDKFREDLSETGNMERNKQYKVYDAGSYRLVWTK